MTTAWAHLPNAKHIDRVLADVKTRPQVWDAAWAAAWDAAWDAAYDATYDATYDAAWDAAQDICAALLAWDDSADFLDMPVDAVRLLAASGHHPAVLMLPACIALSTVRS